MISEHDLEAFGYYENVEAQAAAAVSAMEKGVRLQNETLQAGVVAFEMALDFVTAPMMAAAALSSGAALAALEDRDAPQRRL